jgi:Ca-activated chloride channel homolog
MKKLLLSTICLMLAFTSRAQEQETPRPTASLRVDVNLVELHVSVMDGTGRPVGGLRQEHFKVTENNITQPITIFKHEDQPVSLGLVVDNSRSIEPRKGRLDAAALSFVANSNPDDETFIVHFDFDAKLSQDFTDSRTVLSQKLSSAKPYGQTALYDGLLLALDTMEKARYQKKALLLVTDGIDNVSKGTLRQVLDRVKREHVMVFPVGLLSQSGGQQAEDSLISIAEASGGRAYFPNTPEEARVAMDVIARDLREQYTLAYLPSNVLRNGSWRSVRVEINPPKGYPANLSTNYRHGYYAPEQDR